MALRLFFSNFLKGCFMSEDDDILDRMGKGDE